MIRLRELNRYRAKGHTLYGTNDVGGAFEIPSETNHATLRVIASNGEGWDHVSVSVSVPRTPTWAEMEQIKRLFFHPHEVAMQLHVAVANHISCHPYTLHLWRPHEGAIPLPPHDLV